MPTFEYQHPDGRTIERDYAIGKARKWILFEGKRCERAVSMPTFITPSFGLGKKPSTSNSLPRWYGYRAKAYDEAWNERMKRLPIEDSPVNRVKVLEAQQGPSNAEVDRRSRKMAEKAKALDQFDRTGRPLAHTTRGVANHVARGRAQGDPINWD